MVLQVLLYPSNVINYLRLLLLILMFFKIKKSPIFAFMISVLGGFIDLVDGPIARHTLYTSKFGMFLDILMDRLTHVILFIYLSRIYTKYWHIFCMLALIEFTRELSSNIANSHSHFLSLLNLLQASSTQNDLSIKMQYEIYSIAGIKTDKLLLNETIKNIVNKNVNTVNAHQLVEPDSFIKSTLNYLISSITPMTWYLSDLFYWILYCGAFTVVKATKSNSTQSENDERLVDSNNNTIFNNYTENRDKFELVVLVDDYSTNTVSFQTRNDFDVSNKVISIRTLFLRILREIKYSFKFFLIITDSIGTTLSDFFFKAILTHAKFNFVKKYINLVLIFRLFGLLCYFFTIYRFYLSLCTLFSNVEQIVRVDNEYNVLIKL